jgi:predicted transposase/invertase (TIGR01784 family)
MEKVNNPHDRLIRETLSRKETAIDFFKNYLPENILELIDTDTIEISKDSFIEKELADFYSDILYKVEYKGSPGFVYLLFEHKSYQETLIQFQLFGYIHKIYSLYLKQTKAKKLPIILPIVLYHGRKKWEISTQFSGIIEGPFKAFKEYVPDFKYILFDLTQYTDEQIKGNVQTQLALLLLKYILDPDLLEKLPDILSLLSEIINQDTGLQTLEVLLRYLYSTIEDKNMDKVKNIFEQTLSNKKGVSAMATIAEKFINEGIQQGRQQGIQQGIQRGRQQGIQQGLQQAIELGLELKFGDKGLSYVQKIKNITDIQKLENIVKAIKLVKKLDELDYIIG